jgi:pimeloyl-ACP methyl ester carboxylesterase
MQLALTYPDLVERLIVVDMAPGPSKSDHTGIFDALLGLDLATLDNRSQAEAFLKERIPEVGTVQFLLKNITRNPDGSYAWKMNLPVLFDQYQEVLRPLSGTPFLKPTLFIRGGRSHYIRTEDWPGILSLFPNAQLETIEAAGHWVHADQPAALLEIIQRFLTISE